MVRVVNFFRKRWGILTAICLIFIFESGFQIFLPVGWDVNASNPVLWLKVDKAIYDLDFDETKLSDGNDPLAGRAEGTKMAALLQLIVDDYNNIETSYLRLALVPTEGVILPDSDLEYDEAEAEDQTIEIKLGSSSGLAAAGEARPEFNDEYTQIVSCSIVLAKSLLAVSAADAKRTLTHEIGHCVGLAHNHPDIDSVMSYGSDRHGLGVDDKMGLTFLYPVEDSYADEAATFGLSCSMR